MFLWTLWTVTVSVSCAWIIDFQEREHFSSEQRPVENSSHGEKIHHTHDVMRMCKEAIKKGKFSYSAEIWFLTEKRCNQSKQKQLKSLL